MLKLKWRELSAPGYWTAELTSGLCVLVQPDDRQSVARIGLLEETECYCDGCGDNNQSEDWVISEPRTQHDVADAMARCEQLAADWVREQFGVLL